jgi:hypothetical protein
VREFDYFDCFPSDAGCIFLPQGWRLPYIGVRISLWLFLFFYLQQNQKNIFLDGLKKLDQRSHKCVELRGQYVE